MKIRAITLGYPLKQSDKSLKALENNLEKILELRTKFSDNNIEVQTVRFCSLPYDLKTVFDENYFNNKINYKIKFIFFYRNLNFQYNKDIKAIISYK